MKQRQEEKEERLRQKEEARIARENKKAAEAREAEANAQREEAEVESVQELIEDTPCEGGATAEPEATEGGTQDLQADEDTNEVNDQSNKDGEESSRAAIDARPAKGERGAKTRGAKREPKARGRGRGAKNEQRVYRAKEPASAQGYKNEDSTAYADCDDESD